MTKTLLQAGDKLSGFQVKQIASLPDLNATLIQLIHSATGARWAHITCEDRENLFAVAFRTPPSDSTGIAHILEHTVLCGSKRFPVRDPFFSMLKRSLSTFMNAMTASDWTVYPFSTQNRKDFDNLLSIYLDAAFFPLLRRIDFLQEGHRLEFNPPNDTDARLDYKGVVYNEMKGAMASPASLLYRRLGKYLYPTTCYHFNSGGEPDEIPGLTHEQLKQFHARYYHPSNAWFYSYGNFDLAEHLEAVETQVLNRFDRQEIDSSVPSETRYDRPFAAKEPFPIESGTSIEKKSMIQVAWLTTDIEESFDRLALSLLSNLLIGNQAAPLYQALINSGLGGNIAPGSGYQDENRTTYFAAGLQGTDPDQTEAIEALILETLQKTAETGFSRKRIEGVIHRLEFSHREVSGSRYPYSLGLLMRMIGPWLHADDPLTPLNLEENLKRIRHEIDKGPFFEECIHRFLLNNQHRVTLTLYPDKTLQKKQNQQLTAKLQALTDQLTQTERQTIIAETQALKDSQETPEDIFCLPTLTIKDIPEQEEETLYNTVELAMRPAALFPQPTNGIGYFSALFPTTSVPIDLMPYIPLFCSVITQMGAAGQSYVTMAERMEAETGGIQFTTEIHDNPTEPDRFEALVGIRGKALIRKQEQLFDIMFDYCRAADFTNTKRLRTVLLQILTSFENSIQDSGHLYALRAGAACLSTSASLREKWSGISLLKLLRRLTDMSDAALAEVADRLQQIGLILTNKGELTCAITCEKDELDTLSPIVSSFIDKLATVERPKINNLPTYQHNNGPLGWIASVPVAFVTRCFKGVHYTHADSAPLLLLSKLVKDGYLHREIREKGGAYGGMASYDNEAGIFSFLSYRDPHIKRTLQVYDEAARWAADGNFSDEAIREALLSVFSNLDRPLSPGNRGNHEFSNLRQGLTLKMRQQFRRNLLATTRNDLTRVAKEYLLNNPIASIDSILASDEKLRTEMGETEITIAQI